jgi:hypothetical protein
MNLEENEISEYHLNFTLNSSEAIMFDQGGKHTIKIPDHILQKVKDDNISSLVVSFQISGGASNRYKWIKREAATHNPDWDNLNVPPAYP